MSEAQLKAIESTILRISSKTISVFFSELVPSHFFDAKGLNGKLPLSIVRGQIVLCVSAIGCPDSFVKAITEVPIHVPIFYYVNTKIIDHILLDSLNSCLFTLCRLVRRTYIDWISVIIMLFKVMYVFFSIIIITLT